MRNATWLLVVLCGCLDVDRLSSGAPDQGGSPADLGIEPGDGAVPTDGPAPADLATPDLASPGWVSVYATPGGEGLNAIFGTGASAIWAVGEKGAVVSNTGTTGWSAASVSGMTQPFRGVWAAAATDVWAVGDGGNSYHTTDGAAWSKVATGTTVNVNALSATSATDLWAATDNQKIMGVNYEALRGSGTAWMQSASQTVRNAQGIFAGRPGGSPLVWLVGDGKTAAAFSLTTSTWINYVTTAAGNYGLRAVWASDASSVWAVGTGGTIVRFDGTLWSSSQSGTTAQLNGIWGTSGSDLWAVGSKGALLHFDGAAWRVVAAPISEDLNAVWGSGGRFWAVGSAGRVYEYRP